MEPPTPVWETFWFPTRPAYRRGSFQHGGSMPISKMKLAYYLRRFPWNAWCTSRNALFVRWV